MKHLTYKGYDIVVVRGGRKGSGSYAYLYHHNDEGRVVSMTMTMKNATPLNIAVAIKSSIQQSVTQDIEHRTWFADYQKGMTTA